MGTVKKEDENSISEIDIAESSFTEIDILLKIYGNTIGKELLDNTYNELSLLHTSYAYLLSNHINEHKLSNVDIEKFVIPDSPFKDKNGNLIDTIDKLSDNDLLQFLMNLIMNARNSFMYLSENSYLTKLEDDMFMSKSALLYNINNIFDRSILLLNNKYSKLILNIK